MQHVALKITQRNMPHSAIWHWTNVKHSFSDLNTSY